MTYDQAVDYLARFRTASSGRDRSRLKALLARLGNPQNRLRCVHVVGTNGKGSTVAFLEAILRAAGVRTGAYFSPYVFDLRERWLLEGEMISRETLAKQVTRLAEAADDAEPVSEFELKTAAAFLAFAEAGVEIALIEAGIGGRYDATNLIPPPLAVAITSIGWDHMHLLGDTLEKIARDKAGVLKPGVAACVTPVPPGEALEAIADEAAAAGVPLIRVAEDLLPAGVPLGLRGPHQRGNAATAVGVARTLRERHGLPIDAAAVRQGLERARLPGRFQVQTREGRTLTLDVAHNEEGARALAAALGETFPGRRVTLVVGFKRTHSPEPFLAALAAQTARVIATAPPFQPLPADDIVSAARRLGLPVERIEPAAAAIRSAWERAAPGEIVAVTGSFYTVGETPAALRAEEEATPLSPSATGSAEAQTASGPASRTPRRRSAG